MPQGPRERLIGAAIDLVREHGVDGTGLSQLIERSCSARRSIYQHFPGGKGELIEASTTAAGQWLRSVIHDVGPTMTMTELVDETVRQVGENLVADDYGHGCPVAAAAMADSRGIRDAAGNAFTSWVDEVESLLVQEGHAGAEARSLAGFMISSIEGALLRARASRSTQPLEEVREHLSGLLAGPSRRSGGTRPFRSRPQR